MRKSRVGIYAYLFLFSVPFYLLVRYSGLKSFLGIQDDTFISVGLNSLNFLLLTLAAVFLCLEIGREVGRKEMAEKLNKNPEDYYDRDDKDFTLTSVMKDVDRGID